MGSMNRTHGQSYSPEYTAWKHMRDRCFNKKSLSYRHYGGRGITVCNAWLDFNNFVSYIGLRPTPQHSLDRIDNDGDYEPGNVRWATKSEQNFNKRRLRKTKCSSRGVTLTDKRYKRPYKAYIAVNGKSYYLGTYTTEEEASSVHENVREQIYEDSSL